MEENKTYPELAYTSENVYLNRIPPNDQDAEQAILGCMLFDNEGVSIAFEKLKGDDFYRPDHKVIFESIKSLKITFESFFSSRRFSSLR